MITRIIALLALVLSCHLRIAAQTPASAEARTTLLFAVNDFRLDETALSELQRFVAATDRSEEHEFIITGHTDSDGGTGFNEVLAKHRAASVRERLIALGVAADRIGTKTFGERRPVAANASAEEKQLNRRVEIHFSRQALSSVDDLQRRIGNARTTTTRIDPTKAQWVAGLQGSAVRIPGGALRDAAGNPVKGAVEVTVTEALQLADMLAEGLSTVSDGQLLITGGMLKVEATDAKGNPLQLDSAARMLIALPASMREEGMSLFTSTTGTDWSNTGQPPADPCQMPVIRAPRMAWPVFERPTYKPDLSARPVLPTEPVRPREPQPPRRESYTSKVAWYQALSRARIAADDQRRFDNAMTVYEEKLQGYQRKMDRYHDECRTWPARYAAHKSAFAEWQSDTACAHEDFWKVTMPQAEERFKEELDHAHALHAKRVEAWRAGNEDRVQLYGRCLDSLGLKDGRALQGYVFAANAMGWINCDRFYDVPKAQQYEMIVQDPDTAKKHVYLVFNRINSMMQLPRYPDGRFLQGGLPRHEPATLVAYKVVDGKAWLCKTDVRNGQSPKLDFKPSTIAEVRTAIQGLRGG